MKSVNSFGNSLSVKLSLIELIKSEHFPSSSGYRLELPTENRDLNNALTSHMQLFANIIKLYGAREGSV